MEYALRYPQYLSGLLIFNMTASVAEYVRHAEQLLGALPPAARATIEKHRVAHDFESGEYEQVLTEQLYSKYVSAWIPGPSPCSAPSAP